MSRIYIYTFIMWKYIVQQQHNLTANQLFSSKLQCKKVTAFLLILHCATVYNLWSLDNRVFSVYCYSLFNKVWETSKSPEGSTKDNWSFGFLQKYVHTTYLPTFGVPIILIIKESNSFSSEKLPLTEMRSTWNVFQDAFKDRELHLLSACKWYL